MAEKYAVRGYDPAAAKAAFFDIYINTYCRGPGAATIAFPGAVALVRACAAAGLATAVASSAERVKVGAAPVRGQGLTSYARRTDRGTAVCSCQPQAPQPPLLDTARQPMPPRPAPPHLASPRLQVDANLAAAGFNASDFGCVVSGSSFERNKPAPDIFLAAAAGLGVGPRDCVVIEDTEAGVLAARAAGMRVVGVTTTLGPGEMRALAPDAVWPDVSALSAADLCAVRYAGGAQPGAPPAEAAAAAAATNASGAATAAQQ